MRQKRWFVILAAAALITLAGATVALAAGAGLPVRQATDEAGLVIVAVDPDGPAAEAGVARGDILYAIGEQDTNSRGDVAAALADLAAGDEVTVVVTHGDEERTLTLIVGEQDGRAYLGIQPYFAGQRDAAPAPEMALSAAPGAVVVEVVADSPAAEAGLQAGDVIVAVNGDALDQESSLADVIGALEPGDEVTLEVQREGEAEALSLAAILGENPEKEGVAFLGVHYQQAPTAAFGRLPFGQGEDGAMPNFHDWQFEMPEGMPEMPFSDETIPFGQPFGDVEAGVVVTDVAEDSPAAEAGLAEGDLIVAVGGAPVATPQDVAAAVSELKPGDALTLSVQKSDADDAADIEVTLGARPDDAERAYLGVALGIFRAMQSDDAMPGFQFNFPFGQDGQDDGNALPFEDAPQSPEDLLEQLFPGLSQQQNS